MYWSYIAWQGDQAFHVTQNHWPVWAVQRTPNQLLIQQQGCILIFRSANVLLLVTICAHHHTGFLTT